MNKTIVVYKNHLNKFTFDGELSESAQVILFNIFKESKEKNTPLLELSYKGFKNDIDHLITRMSLNDFDKILLKLVELNAHVIKETDTNKQMMAFNFFDNILVNREEDRLTIKLTEASLFFFNDVKRDFTKWDLINFSDVKGKYNRIIFRILKTFANTGIWRVKYIDFKKYLSLPKTYRACDIEERVLKKAIKELCPKYFTNLTIEKIKEGKSIKTLVFKFDKQPITEEQKRMYKEFKKLSPLEQASYNNTWEEIEASFEDMNFYSDFDEIKPTKSSKKLFKSKK